MSCVLKCLASLSLSLSPVSFSLSLPSLSLPPSLCHYPPLSLTTPLSLFPPSLSPLSLSLSLLSLSVSLFQSLCPPLSLSLTPPSLSLFPPLSLPLSLFSFPSFSLPLSLSPSLILPPPSLSLSSEFIKSEDPGFDSQAGHGWYGNNLVDVYQSAFRKDHSTETAVLSVLDGLLVKMDERLVSLAALLDLSAAFDTLDHSILLQRLKLKAPYFVPGGIRNVHIPDNIILIVCAQLHLLTGRGGGF